jgi:hypothetical protein
VLTGFLGAEVAAVLDADNGAAARDDTRRAPLAVGP